MPELPEVTTTVKGLQRVLPSLKISDVWTDLPPPINVWRARAQRKKLFKNTLKDPLFFRNFKKRVVGAKVLNVERRAKNILINLNNGQTILIHMKMTGHLIFGKYVFTKKINPPAGGWLPHPRERASLHDPYNRFIHVVFTFSNGKHLAFCDSRKFGKVTLIDTKLAHTTVHLKHLGPEPLEKSFTFSKFQAQIGKKPNWPIKQTLMDQGVLAGIGNIYSDEALWLAGVNPKSTTSKIPSKYLKDLFTYTKQVLKKGINFGGDSMSDYRDIDGNRGKFQHHHNVYQKKNEKCGKKGCKGAIIRELVAGRSAHFCPAHQKLFL